MAVRDWNINCILNWGKLIGKTKSLFRLKSFTYVRSSTYTRFEAIYLDIVIRSTKQPLSKPVSKVQI